MCTWLTFILQSRGTFEICPTCRVTFPHFLPGSCVHPVKASSMAPWDDTPVRVVIEFKKGGQGAHRKIEVTKHRDMMPPQLYGRVEMPVWQGFMTEVQQMADQHPYLQMPSASICCNNMGALLCFLSIGFGCFEPDGGDYGVWLAAVDAMLARNAPYFAHGGSVLSLQRVHGSYWIQIDVNPAVVAVGAPVVTGAPLLPSQPVYAGKAV